jgi:hypothetical protein
LAKYRRRYKYRSTRMDAGLETVGRVDIPHAVAMERAQRQEAGHRDLAGAVFGDPPQGFSALDRKGGRT